MPKIFISYRREDSEHVAGRIHDRLDSHFGREAVFIDVDTIPFGVDFREYLNEAVAHCDVLLAVIGEGWLEVRHQDGPKQGQRRLDDPGDFIRIEVQAALERGIPVIPVLVGRAAMPGEAQLPQELQGLAYRNAAEVRSGRDFHDHMDRLIRGIEYLARQQETQHKGDKQQPREQEETPQAAHLRSEQEGKQREKEEAEKREKELAQLQEEGETKLSQFIREALERTQGKPTQDDTAAANDIRKRHGIPNERAKQIVAEVW